MADDKLRRKSRGDAQATCDVCGKAEYLCPSCPRRPMNRPYRFDHGWKTIFDADRELAQVQLRNAKAARALACCAQSHPAYSQLDAEYIAAGMDLLALRARRTGKGTEIA